MKFTLSILTVFITYTLMSTPALSAYLSDLGRLTDLISITNAGEQHYRFTLPQSTVTSIFLNGLSVGYQAALIDKEGNLLAITSNDGTSWPNKNSNAIVMFLKAGDYFIYISMIKITEHSLYRKIDQTFTINLIPDNAPDLAIVAALDSPEKTSAHFIATGMYDEKTINLALNSIRQKGSGKILLRPGTYQIYDNILTTINNLTFLGSGWGTILKIADQAKLQRAGVLRSKFFSNEENRTSPFFHNQHFMHFAIDGNKSTNPFFQNNVGNYGTYQDSSFEDLHFHDFSRYGFDPHGTIFGPTSTVRLQIKDCLSEHNNQDGIVCDNCQQSLIYNNIILENGRHGVNIVTGANHNRLFANVIANNGGTGITIQPGISNLNRRSSFNRVEENQITQNAKGGILIYLSQYNILIDNRIEFNQRYEVILKASKYNLLKNNFLRSRSGQDNKELIAILIAGERFDESTNNQIFNNSIQAMHIDAYKFGISERGHFEDYNYISKNALENITKPIHLVGAHSKASDNTSNIH